LALDEAPQQIEIHLGIVNRQYSHDLVGHACSLIHTLSEPIAETFQN
jgi:hypothetical protein